MTDLEISNRVIAAAEYREQLCAYIARLKALIRLEELWSAGKFWDPAEIHPDPMRIFGDGFESGNTSMWSSTAQLLQHEVR
jgi:hypothetical protein